MKLDAKNSPYKELGMCHDFSKFSQQSDEILSEFQKIGTFLLILKILSSFL